MEIGHFKTFLTVCLLGKWINNAKCPIGFYCVAETKEPKSCPKGTVGIESGSISDVLIRNNNTADYEKTCIPCPAGLYCPYLNITSTEPTDGGAQECKAGFFCAEGSDSQNTQCSQGHYCPKATPVEVSCPYGTYQQEVGQSICIDCPRGFFCNIAEGTIFPEICLRGHYCPEQGLINPVPCPPGFYNPSSDPGNEPISIDYCLSCPKGFYCDETGLMTPSKTCEPGFFCNSTATARDPAEDDLGNGPCPVGHFCKNEIDNFNTFEAIRCPLGTYNPSTHGKDETACRPCKAGYACTSDEIIICNPGSYCPNNEIISSPSGKICPASHFCPEGTADPIPCELGTYQLVQGQAECKNCDPGFYCEKNDAGVIEKIECPLKFYCPEKSPYPTKCPPGTYVIAGEDEGLQKRKDCRACPKGNYCRDGIIQGGFRY